MLSQLEKFLPILWRPSVNQFEIKSPLPPNQLIIHLRTAVEQDSAVQGQVVSRGLRLERTPGTTRSTGTFAPICYGAIAAENGPTGTRLLCHFQLNPVMRLFLGVWFGGSVIIALVFLAAGLLTADAGRTATDALPILVLALQPGLGLILLRYQQAKGRADERWLRKWLDEAMRRV